MHKIRRLSIAFLVCLFLAGSSRAANAQLHTAALGGLMGTMTGGYITLSIVVARAQLGHYLHEMEDVMGWNAVPVIVGGPVGVALGYWQADRLMSGFVYGSAGTLIGGTAGFLIGMKISEHPEGKWAGGAIGAGAGMAFGAFYGIVVNPSSRWNPFSDNKTVIPLEIRIPLQ